MHSLEEKNHLSNEIERLKKKVEEGEQNKARIQSQLEAQNLEIYNLKLFGQQQQQQNAYNNSVEFSRYVFVTRGKYTNTIFSFLPYVFQLLPGEILRSKYDQVEILKELQKSRLEVENVRRQMLQQEIHFNIQQTEALTR